MKNHKNVSTNNFKIENLSEITEDIKKNQMEILEPKNITTAIKAQRMRPRNRTEQRVTETEDRMAAITQPE